MLFILIDNYYFSSNFFNLFQLTIIIFHPQFLFILFTLIVYLFFIGRLGLELWGTFSVSKRISKSPVIFLFQVINTSRFYGDLPLSLLPYINTILYKPSQESEQSCIRVLDVSLLPLWLCPSLWLYYGTLPSVVFSFFILFYILKLIILKLKFH